MIDTATPWTPLETFDDFDNGLSELIDLWSGPSTPDIKQAALAHFKADLEAATLTWVDNRVKSKKYAAIAAELAEFEQALAEGDDTAPQGTA